MKNTPAVMSSTSAPAMLPALTGLRGLASIWVVLFHISFNSGALERAGYLGVDVFFILSGFILSHVYANAMRPLTIKNFIHFLKVRIARIYPPHLAVLFALALIVLLWPGFADSYIYPHERWGLPSFVASLLLIQNWAYFLPTCWNTPAWSLSAEWFAYLLFPLFLFATQWPRSTMIPVLLAALSLGLLCLVLASRGNYYLGADGTPGMLKMACEFAAGCFLSTAHRNGLLRLRLVVDAIAIGLLSCGIFLVGARPAVLPAFCLIILLGAQGDGPIARLLSMWPVVLLGEISYSLYIVHWAVLQVANRTVLVGSDFSAVHVVGKIAIVILCIAFASASYRWIELPSRRWGRRIASRAPKAALG